MSKGQRENRVPIMFGMAELEAIDDWRFKNRIATRAEAIRRLCQTGLVWDTYKDQLGENYLHALHAAARALERVGQVHSSGEMSAREAELSIELVDIFSSIKEVAPVLIRAVGGANNLRLGTDIEKEMENNRAIELSVKTKAASKT